MQAQEAPASQDAPAGLQVFVGLLGLAAVPVVAYSLYTLSTTGAALLCPACHSPHGSPKCAVALVPGCGECVLGVAWRGLHACPVSHRFGACSLRQDSAVTAQNTPAFAGLWVQRRLVTYSVPGTGCGLPPGPNGALGLAEGLSYVTLLGIAAWSLGMKATTSRGLPAGACLTLNHEKP